jgi:DNA-binding MarR family transcriptional regulator
LALEQRKLIERHPDANHGRIARFTLTARGSGVLEQSEVIADEVESRAVGDLSAAERRTLVSSAVNALRRLEHPEGPAPKNTGARRRNSSGPKPSPNSTSD